jgi:hypothetical protein
MDLKRFRNLPAIRDIEACQNFTAVANVVLQDWEDLDDATCWLKLRWREAGHGYRRAIIKAVPSASFELADSTDAVEFSLRFG